LLAAVSPLAGSAVLAQGAATGSPRLEDLIPDSAVEDPEGWATRDSPASSGSEPADPAAPDSGSAMDEMPEISLPWPEPGDVPQPEPLQAEPDIDFATDFDDQVPALPDGKKIRVGSDMTLVFPDTGAEFELQDEFVDRFRELSTIAELSDDEDNLAQLSARARQDADLLDRLLRNYGYYDGYVLRSMGNGTNGDGSSSENPEVRFDIVSGTQYRFGAIDLGALPQAPDYEALRKSFEIWPGDPVLADKIVQENFDLDQALGETGYPFAAIGNPSLLIDHARQEGDLTLPVEPGGRYRFGSVVSGNPDFLSSKHLQRIARFDPGDIYKRSDEMDLRRAILATGLVSSVTISRRETRPPAPGQDGEVALDIELAKAPLRTIAGTIGYGSGEGVRIEGSWEHRNLFPPEGALRVRGIAGTKEQLAGVTFRRNNWRGRDKILTVDAYATNIDRDAYEAHTVSLLATYERVSTLLFQKPLTWSVGLEVIATDEREASVQGVNTPRATYFVAALPMRAMIDTSDSLLDPTRGFRLGGRISPEISSQGGSQSTYARTQIDATYYQPMGEKVVIAARTRVGSILGTGLGNIAPSRRFYAGGGGSVRGYGYQKIGPRDDVGDPNGGRSLVEFSLEARIRTGMFGGALSVVPFIDAGNVDRSTTPSFSDMRFGAGLGVRYNTGFGPIRLDVATPLNPRSGDNPIAVYIGLGQAF